MNKLKKQIKRNIEYDIDLLTQLELQGWELDELWDLFNRYEKSCIIRKLSCENCKKKRGFEWKNIYLKYKHTKK